VHAWVSFHQENVRGSGPHPSALTPFGEGESARYEATAPSPRCSKNSRRAEDLHRCLLEV
jgi:hypothetical protein